MFRTKIAPTSSQCLFSPEARKRGQEITHRQTKWRKCDFLFQMLSLQTFSSLFLFSVSFLTDVLRNSSLIFVVSFQKRTSQLTPKNVCGYTCSLVDPQKCKLQEHLQSTVYLSINLFQAHRTENSQLKRKGPHHRLLTRCSNHCALASSGRTGNALCRTKLDSVVPPGGVDPVDASSVSLSNFETKPDGGKVTKGFLSEESKQWTCFCLWHVLGKGIHLDKATLLSRPITHQNNFTLWFFVQPTHKLSHLCDSFAEISDLRYSLQVLTIRIGVQLEVSLQNLDLFFCEGRSHPFGFVFHCTFVLWKRIMKKMWSTHALRRCCCNKKSQRCQSVVAADERDLSWKPIRSNGQKRKTSYSQIFGFGLHAPLGNISFWKTQFYAWIYIIPIARTKAVCLPESICESEKIIINDCLISKQRTLKPAEQLKRKPVASWELGNICRVLQRF